MWAHDFLLAETHAKTLKTHLTANNIFLRWWVREFYVPEDMQLGTLFRGLRFVLSLAIFLVVVAFFILRHDPGYYYKCEDRTKCQEACIIENFPELPCTSDEKMQINYGNNVYSNLFQWTKREDGVALEVYDYCVDQFPQVVPNEETMEAALYDDRQPRIQACFPACFSIVGVGQDSLYKRTWGTEDFTFSDTRPLENSPNCVNDHIWCVNPFHDYCEVSVYPDETCIYGEGRDGFCFQFSMVVFSSLVSVPVQLGFDWSLIFILFVRPETIQDFDQQAMKCCFQMFFTIMLVIATLLFTSSLCKVYYFSRFPMLMITWCLTLILDQFRNIISQIFTWYVILRRFGQVPIMDEDAVYGNNAENDDLLSPLEAFLQLVQIFVESRRFDFAVWLGISTYAMFLVLQMSIELYVNDYALHIMKQLDTAFLVFFLSEILLRLIAVGFWYLRDLFNLLDVTIVVISFFFNVLSIEQNGGLPLLRLMRLLRLVLALRKVSAEEKTPQRIDGGLSFSSPVERVLEIFREVKETKGLPSSLKDQVDWAVDVISSNKLYSISVDLNKLKNGQGVLDQEVGDWVRLATELNTEKSTGVELELEKLLIGGSGYKRKAKEELINNAKDAVHKTIVDATALLTVDNLEHVGARLEALNLGKPIVEERSKFGRKNEIDAQKTLTEDENPPTSVQILREGDQIHLADAVIQYLNKNIDDWYFDLPFLESIVGERCMQLVLVTACIHQDLFTLFEIPPESLKEFCFLIEQGYERRNPYHNAVHAADVVQCFNVLFHWFLRSNTEVLEEQELLAGLIAAAIHDYEHPGFNNPFLIRSKHPMSLRYNDISVLENHHVSAGFIVMMSVTPDPLAHCTEQQYREIRNSIISMVLATDIANHFTELSALKNKLNTKGFPRKRREDKKLILDMMLHSSDIGNAARDLPTYLSWVPRVMEEFFRQGDVEKERNMTVSMFYDRTNTNIAQCQKGFIEVIVLPTYAVLGQIIPTIQDIILPSFDKNLAYFNAQLDDGDDLAFVNKKATDYKGPNLKKFQEKLGKFSAKLPFSKKKKPIVIDPTNNGS